MVQGDCIYGQFNPVLLLVILNKPVSDLRRDKVVVFPWTINPLVSAKDSKTILLT